MGACLTPFYKRSETGEWLTLPCSKCPNCLKRRTSAWSFRLIKEGEKSFSALFVTLTYDTRYVPLTKNGYMTLDKKDCQKFMKRLRKLSMEKIKYYLAGEYGTKTMRPHYHAIIFNADREMVERAWALDNKKIGDIFIGDVNGASIGYTLKYMSKEKQIPVHKNDDRLKEFSLMSKGLGKNYLTKNMLEWHHNDLLNRCFVPLKDNKKIAMPRYYKDKIYTHIEKGLIADYMKDKSIVDEQKLIEEFGDSYELMRVETTQNEFRRMYKKSKEREKL